MQKLGLGGNIPFSVFAEYFWDCRNLGPNKFEEFVRKICSPGSLRMLIEIKSRAATLTQSTLRSQLSDHASPVGIPSQKKVYLFALKMSPVLLKDDEVIFSGLGPQRSCRNILKP